MNGINKRQAVLEVLREAGEPISYRLRYETLSAHQRSTAGFQRE